MIFEHGLADQPMTGVPLDTRVALLREHGSFVQAYSATYQPEMKHFGDARGFLAYKMVLGTAMVLGDPMAPGEQHEPLIRRFLAAKRDLCFCYVSRDTAELLVTLGFFINEMGWENRIDLTTYDFAGQGRRNVRRSLKRVHERGYAIRESSIDAVGHDEMKRVSTAWRRARPVSSREMAFINRPMLLRDEPDVRTIFAFDREEKLAGFSVFDPVYEHGEVVGYGAQANRQSPDADPMLQHAIKRYAIELLQKEGKKWLFLGLSPFDGIEDRDFAPNKNWLVRRSFRFAFSNPLFNRFVFPSQTIAVHKRQFRATTYQMYFGFNTLPSLPRVLKLARACRLV